MGNVTGAPKVSGKVLGTLIVIVILANVASALFFNDDNSPEALARAEEKAICERIKDEPYETFKAWFEQPIHWMTRSDLGDADLDALAEKLGSDLGCSDIWASRNLLNGYERNKSEFPDVWPIGCLAATFDETSQQHLTAAATTFLDVNPAFMVNYHQRSAEERSAAAQEVLGAVGCQVASRDVRLETDAKAVLDDLANEILRAQQEYSNTGQSGPEGSDGDVNLPNVNAPDVNPFYCSWSWRGGFNCGVSMR